ncbi:heptaprenylglyceryl phosphate synthase [Paenibacillus sacheonensis]|uniref:Heptaprenylglyceryl phosphate synthase n=1 Tax=Paenibacillus sacheonensis TaxID=742054 RepID=A0A7X5C4A3_9BACL|nr:heptaprenylglyceryl phosphate synthase [Paenibacillus sacheonensis]MBM7566427.1 putative glycerol-1-phosphate prenyltransferase [Paenibacillus sacheonensis]NBC73110.1 heptaprenylglyceryl phosphate synthase [Paenibacillus sacheonensis]
MEFQAIYETWRHVFKLDPERAISDEQLDAICMSGTDAVIVGGSTGVTFDNTVDLMSRIRRYEVPCALEVSSEEAAVPGFDHYFIPLVLNTDRAEWMAGRQIGALRAFGAFIPWEITSAEGYLILNGEAEAAKLTGANAALDAESVTAHIYMADRLMRLPIIYMEYSGKFGDMELVKRAGRITAAARLFYGGGIDNADKARLAAEAAHTVIVGNAIYDDLAAALSTVAAVAEVPYSGK